jgi:hypothetical protein
VQPEEARKATEKAALILQAVSGSLPEASFAELDPGNPHGEPAKTGEPGP